MMSYDEFVEHRDYELTAKYERSTIKGPLDFDDFRDIEYEAYVTGYVKAIHEREEELPSGFSFGVDVSNFTMFECEIPF